ncbi:DUF692 domain-containing protein [Nocardia huaxiensis]|uniref:DUF692 domain-containing protein n=1 Tax=Nocardia huaxiensis TaxID=2755382 RepID=A0A7D6V9G1_9NOCA|nr:DUF692 domain-containing protein [Nocardia huaxiensis]QLY30921.1 DUF692 domain-containing protein [Nocardia huaxiensis]
MSTPNPLSDGIPDSNTPSHGTGGPLPAGALGIGWRREICGIIAGLDGISFCEVIAESLPRTTPRGQRAVLGRRRSDPRFEVTVPDELEALRSTGVAVVPHGISLSLGSAEEVDAARVAHMAACARALGSPLVSEHIAFVRAGGMEAGHLLPVPRTREALDALARNISRTQRELEVPLAVENIAALFEWPDAEFSEAEFLRELVERTGVYLLLDIANVYANARNRSQDPLTELLSLPAERIAYCHVAGGREAGGRYHDTHVHPVPDEVLGLVAEFTAHNPVPLMLERDGNYPPASELVAELSAIARAAGRPAITLRPEAPVA